jgi:hypothetical protein
MKTAAEVENAGVSDTRLLAYVTLAAIIVIIGLAFAPSWLLYTVIGVWVFVFFCAIAGLWWASRQPLTPTDRYCARVDEELDFERRAERARVLREASREIDTRGGGGFRA